MGEKRANTDRLLARVAARQHGVISTAQLRGAGLGDQGISKRVKAGGLHRLHRGVSAVGHTNLSFEGRCMAAVLALGDRAAVSHQSAAALWGMLRPHSGPVHITLPGDGGRRKRRGIAIHRSRSLTAGLSISRNGIRVTNVKRTLRDLHRTSPRPVFRRAVRRALDLSLIDSSDLRTDDLTRSELERRFLALCRRHRLPQPEINARIGAYEVDFLWRDRGVVVETDGFRHHADPTAFERDRARDARLQSQGFRVLRFTYRQVADSSADIAASLRRLLGQASLTPNL